MPRVSIARITLILRKNKTLADGTHPIMLRICFKGMKERATGWSCSERDWDERSCCIKGRMQNSIIINNELRKMKALAERVRDTFIAEGIRYTPAMILEKTFEPPREEVRDMKQLSLLYCKETGLSKRTCLCMSTAIAAFERYHGGQLPSIDAITEKDIVGFGRWCIEKKYSDCTIRTYNAKIHALLRWCVSEGVLSVMPVQRYKYYSVFKEKKREAYIHSEAIKMLFHILLSFLIIQDGDMWHWRDGVVESEFFKGKGKIYSLYFYLLGYLLKGLSPVDMLSLKKADIKTVMVGSETYYAIDGYRQKTREKYKIRLAKGTVIAQVMIGGMLMFAEGDSFLPSYNKNYLYALARINKHLSFWWKYCNRFIAERIANGEVLTPIDESCTLYSYRHSYLMAEIQKPDCNWRALALSMGKSPTTLYQYISELTDIDLV